MILTSLRPRETKPAAIDWNREDWGGHVTVAAYIDAEPGEDQ